MKYKIQMKFLKLICILTFTFIATNTIAQTSHTMYNDDLGIKITMIDGVDTYDTVRISIRARTELIYPTRYIDHYQGFLEYAKKYNWVNVNNEYNLTITPLGDNCYDYAILLKDSTIVYDYLIQKDNDFLDLHILFSYFPVYKFSDIEKNKKFNESNYKKNINKANKCLVHKIIQKNKLKLSYYYGYNRSEFFEHFMKGSD